MYFVEGVSNLKAIDGFGVWKILFKNFVHGFEKRDLNYILIYSSVYYYEPQNFLATSPFQFFYLFFQIYPPYFSYLPNKTPRTFGK